MNNLLATNPVKFVIESDKSKVKILKDILSFLFIFL